MITCTLSDWQENKKQKHTQIHTEKVGSRSILTQTAERLRNM